MQSFYLEKFDREMGCTVAEWRMWLPAAMGVAVWSLQPQSTTDLDGANGALQARIPAVPGGALQITWRAGAPRRIALFSLPCLHVGFAFSGVDDAQRYAFMKRFDLYMQRGGG